MEEEEWNNNNISERDLSRGEINTYLKWSETSAYVGEGHSNLSKGRKTNLLGRERQVHSKGVNMTRTKSVCVRVCVCMRTCV